MKNTSEKFNKELSESLQAIEDLSLESTSMLYKDKRRVLQQSSLRFMWVCDSLAEFKHEKATLQLLRHAGWNVILHIQRPFFLKNWALLIKKIKARKINSFFVSKLYKFLYLFDFYLYSQCFPKVLVNPKPLAEQIHKMYLNPETQLYDTN